MPSTGIDFDGTELPMVIERFAERSKRIRRLLPIVAASLVAAVDDVYEAEGPGWEPLAEATLARRRKGSSKILQDTGVMAGSTMGRTGPTWAEARSHVGYAKYHASGTSKMPKRNPFDLGPFEKDVLEDIAELLAKEAAG